MASIPTASVDALVHVKRLRRPKNDAAVHYPLRLNRASWITSIALLSFKAWQIAANLKPFQWFARYGSFAYVSLGENRGRPKMSVRPMISASGRNTLVAAFASLALVAASAPPSAAASTTPAPKAAVAGQAASGATDFSAAKRRYYRRGPNAAALAIMGAATGPGRRGDRRKPAPRLLRGPLLLRSRPGLRARPLLCSTRIL